jgi:hypothetical protein
MGNINRIADNLEICAQAESALADTPAAKSLEQAVFNAVRAYYEHLELRGAIYDLNTGRILRPALHIRCDMSSIEIILGRAIARALVRPDAKIEQP